MPDYSDDDIRNAAEIREWLTKQILEKQDEIEKLQITLNLVDSLLKQGSFRAASNYNVTKSNNKQDLKLQQRPSNTLVSKSSNPSDTQDLKDESVDNEREVRSIKRPKDNLMVASFHIFQDYIDIIPEGSINISIETPPFKSFFLNRILQGMKNKDLEKVKQGIISEPDVMDFEVITDEQYPGRIKNIRISRFKEKERINEIFNTAAWVITRMLEKSEK
ncbi:MAG: hypothetical protein AB7V56_05605 [Candidatus Nitrosocosmicus sp.]